MIIVKFLKQVKDTRKGTDTTFKVGELCKFKDDVAKAYIDNGDGEDASKKYFSTKKISKDGK